MNGLISSALHGKTNLISDWCENSEWIHAATIHNFIKDDCRLDGSVIGYTIRANFKILLSEKRLERKFDMHNMQFKKNVNSNVKLLIEHLHINLKQRQM